MITAFVDADIPIFNCAKLGQTQGWDAEKTIDVTRALISKWVEPIRPCEIVCCMSSYPRYRNDVWPDYKKHRKDPPPPHLEACRAAVQESFSWAALPRLEADDVMGILATSGSFPQPVIVSTDKDMLQIPARIFNPVHGHSRDDIKTITQNQADFWFHFQWMKGDSTDGLPGLPGIGDKKADAFLNATTKDRWESEILAMYSDRRTAIAMARCVRILRTGEWNWKTQQPKLWKPVLQCMENMSMLSSSGSSSSPTAGEVI